MYLENIKYEKKVRLLFIPIYVLMVAGLATIYWIAAGSLTREHSERLQWTARLTDSGLQVTGQEMMKIANLLQTNRTLKEYLYIVTVLGGDRAPLYDLLKPLSVALNIDTLDLYDQQGRRLMDLDTVQKKDPQKNQLINLAGSLPPAIVYGFVETGGVLRVVAISPLRDRGRTLGYFSVGMVIDQRYINMLKSVGGNDIVLVKDGAIVASTVGGVSPSEKYLPEKNKLKLAGSNYSIQEQAIVSVDGSRIGTMVVALPDKVLSRDIAYLKTVMVALILCAALLSYILSRLFIQTLVKPLKSIIAFTRNVSQGELEKEFVVKGTDEIADLAGHLNGMRKQLRSDREELKRYTNTLERIVDERTEQLSKVQHQLLQSQKMEAVGQLAGGMAHDFNNILTAIIGYAGILQRVLPKGDPQQGHVEQIMMAGKRAANLTGSLLAFSRKQALNPAPVDLNAIVQHIEKMLTRLIGEDIDFRTDLAADQLTIMADRGQIEQVLVNLAANARDAMDGGGRLTITTGISPWNGECLIDQAPGNHAEYAMLSLSDTGAGMDQATKEKIFEPFFTTKEVGKGTGLGLAMVYGIVQQHNGCIAVESEKGRGTTFALYFPLIRREAQTPVSATDPDGMRGGTETILVGEDDAVVREIVQLNLQDAGYRVIMAVDGEDLVAKFLAHKDAIQLVLLDVVMPKKNGRAAYEAMRAVAPGLRAVFMSGYTADIVKSKVAIEDNIDLLSKPFTQNDLLKKIRDSLDKRNGP